MTYSDQLAKVTQAEIWKVPEQWGGPLPCYWPQDYQENYLILRMRKPCGEAVSPFKESSNCPCVNEDTLGRQASSYLKDDWTDMNKARRPPRLPTKTFVVNPGNCEMKQQRALRHKVVSFVMQQTLPNIPVVYQTSFKTNQWLLSSPFIIAPVFLFSYPDTFEQFWVCVVFYFNDQQ